MSDFSVPFPHSFAAVDVSGGVLWQQGDVSQVFPLASVTKLLTAVGVHLAIGRGVLSLQQPAGPRGSTVAHLLAHASGLAPEGDGTVMASATATAGERRIYSNQGYEVLGQTLLEGTGVSPSAWLMREIFAPLGLASLRVPGSVASSGLGNVMDLAALAQEFLNPEFLPTDLVQNMQTPAFPGLRGILPGYGMQYDNLWGLGPEIKGTKDPHWTASMASPQTFGHFGISGSFLWVDPVRQVAAVFLGSEEFGPWHKQNWPLLNQRVFSLVTG